MLRFVAFATLTLALSGCAGIAGSGGSSDLIAALKEIASDPNCGHTDRISGNLGGLTGNNLNIFLERSCPAPKGE